MMKWEKPILSVLGISKTKGSSFKALDGVALFSNDLDFVSPSNFKKRKNKNSNGSSDSSAEQPSYGSSSSSS